MRNRIDEAEAARLLLERREIRSSFRRWCEHLLHQRGHALHRHHLLLIDALEKVNAGEIDRLMISMPPGHGKSEYSGQFFVPYFMANNPGSHVIVGTNALDLARSFSHKVRGYIHEHANTLGFGVADDQSGLENWATTNGCSYLTKGAGSSVLGRRARLIIVDDPYASRDDAQRPNVRDEIFRWYSSDLRSRLAPLPAKSAVIVCQTRFHEEDLCGRLLEIEGDRWHVIRLPAICDDEDSDPLGRRLGEALWPEGYPLEELEDRRRVLNGPYDWASQYQQRPAPAEGALFDVARLSPVGLTHELLSGAAIIRAWDLAASVKGDWTVGLKLARLKDSRFVVLDVRRMRGGPHEVKRLMLDTAQEDGRGVRITIPQDPGQAGVAQCADYVAMLAGFRVHTSRETGNKETRAQPVASQVNVGNVSVVAAPWNKDLKDELAMFPAGKFDDMVDALSRAFNVLLESKSKPPAWRHLGIMSR